MLLENFFGDIAHFDSAKDRHFSLEPLSEWQVEKFLSFEKGARYCVVYLSFLSFFVRLKPQRMQVIGDIVRGEQEGGFTTEWVEGAQL